MNFNHRIVIVPTVDEILHLLEHIRYSDSRIYDVNTYPESGKPQELIVDLIYVGTLSGFESHIKRFESYIKRARSTGLEVQRIYKRYVVNQRDYTKIMLITHSKQIADRFIESKIIQNPLYKDMLYVTEVDIQ